MVMVALPRLSQAVDPAHQVSHIISTHRQAVGQPALTWSYRLSLVALARAKNMVAHQYVAHQNTGPHSTWHQLRAMGYHFQSVAELIAVNQTNPAKIVRLWELSTAHRIYLQNRQFRQAGVAIVRTNYGGNLAVVVVLLLANGTR